ncbi:MAG: polysaccharide biosynthesis/export family protein [Planctomycetota bacterium]
MSRSLALLTGLLPLLLTLAGCSSAPPLDIRAMVAEYATHMQQNYLVRPGDRLAVNVVQDPSLTQEVLVSPAGTVGLLRIPGELRVEGRSMSAVRLEIQRAYGLILSEPDVNVSLLEVSASAVFVAGEVRDPGVIPYTKGMTATTAIAAAGGLRITAKWNDVRILRNRPGQEPRTIRLDADRTFHGEGPDFLLLPGDVVYAQTSAIADVGNWVQLYIRNLLPFQFSAVPIVPNY